MDDAVLNRRTLLATAAASSTAGPVSASATTDRTEWRDPARNRTVPALIRLPAQPGPAPLVLLSHGLGGSREGLAYLGIALADAGYAVVHLQHHGSDIEVWQGAPDARASMGAALTDIAAALARLGDVQFALDTVAAGHEPRLRDRVDMERIAVAGHSYGAWTVTHLLGERLPLGGWGLSLPDGRLRAGIALSPIPPFGLAPSAAFGAVTAPILYVTGTEDRGWGAADWQSRTAGFRYAAAPAALAVLAGARHASFAGEAAAGPYWNDPTFQERTARVSRLFLDAVLRGDVDARHTLLDGAGLAAGDRLETRLMDDKPGQAG